MRLDPVALTTEIEALRRAFPATEDDPQDWLLALESETNTMEFVDKALWVMSDALAKRMGLAALIDDLEKREARFEAREQAMRNLLLRVMVMTDQKKLERPLATLSLRQGQPSVQITDDTEIPLPFMRIKSEPNKSAIKEALQRGDFVPGAVLTNGATGITVRRL